MASDLFICGGCVNQIALHEQPQHVIFKAADFLDFLGLFGVPEMNLLIPTGAIDAFAISAESDGKHRSCVTDISCFELTGFTVEDSGGPISARRNDLGSFRVKSKSHHPIGMLLDAQLFCALRNI